MSPRTARKSPTVKPRRSLALVAFLLGSSLLALGILFLLFLSDVRLGQGFFAVRYSPLPQWRLERTVVMLAVGACACGAAWALAQRGRGYLVTGYVLLASALAGFAVFAWYGPPEPLSQHAFNMTSPSADGAFVTQAHAVAAIGDYLRQFPDVTLRRTPKEMGGTRVLSNPPLTTALAYASGRAWGAREDAPGWLERQMVEQLGVEPRDAPVLAEGLRFSVVLCTLLALSGFAAYALGRVFLSSAGSAVFAVVVTFNPCTAHFAPGKDPAQLLTINLMIWAWFAAWKRESVTLAALGGAILTIGCTAGLIHAWVALAALAATLWQSRADRNPRPVLRNVLAAAVGGAVVCAVAYFTIRWNIPRTLWAVTRRWTELQGTFDLDRATWYAIGLPIFLLFLGPGFWAPLGLSLRRPRLRFGMRLAACTAGVMLLIYFPLGMTYELPRLWVAFLPPLVLGLMSDRPLFHASGASPRAARALVWIVAVHVAFTSLHWTLLDARESEFRLTTDRFYN